jgi:hypothetical protein
MHKFGMLCDIMQANPEFQQIHQAHQNSRIRNITEHIRTFRTIVFSFLMVSPRNLLSEKADESAKFAKFLANLNPDIEIEPKNGQDNPNTSVNIGHQCVHKEHFPG